MNQLTDTYNQLTEELAISAYPIMQIGGQFTGTSTQVCYCSTVKEPVY